MKIRRQICGVADLENNQLSCELVGKTPKKRNDLGIMIFNKANRRNESNTLS